MGAHPVLSPALKVVCGLLVALVGFVDADRLTFFVCFYPILFIPIVYPHWTWDRQEVPDDTPVCAADHLETSAKEQNMTERIERLEYQSGIFPV
ncbi:hypothetical protein Pla110_15950 [Polystyrenella longa]|uniref:Uncharacterized protein n=1 Tax=Polystyrenella longa TaxID=2528007 RepID=A0A518CKW7_9PLAN|nr:hypothetical protein [Polystyrenella longa]QDU79875.1 hypothetical protein Pla110_15950 [Polystyrenella longa]